MSETKNENQGQSQEALEEKQNKSLKSVTALMAATTKVGGMMFKLTETLQAEIDAGEYDEDGLVLVKQMIAAPRNVEKILQEHHDGTVENEDWRRALQNLLVKRGVIEVPDGERLSFDMLMRAAAEIVANLVVGTGVAGKDEDVSRDKQARPDGMAQASFKGGITVDVTLQSGEKLDGVRFLGSDTHGKYFDNGEDAAGFWLSAASISRIDTKGKSEKV